MLVENALFASPGPDRAQGRRPRRHRLTLSDTVGFVRSLPTQLVEAFRSHPGGGCRRRRDSARGGCLPPGLRARFAPSARSLPRWTLATSRKSLCWNKADAADPFVLERMRQREPQHVIVSARTGEGIEELKQKIADTIPALD